MPLTRRTANALLIAMAAAATSPARSAGVTRMKIGVIGSGSLGGTVGGLWVKAGHEVMFSSRHPEELTSLVRPLGPRASTGTAQQAAAFGDVILFAVPYEALRDLGSSLRALLRGKVVLDSCNPSASDHARLAQELGTNNVGEMSRQLLPETRLVRVFSAVDATSAEASFNRRTEKLGVPLAGDDTGAMKTAEQLVRDAGCEPVVAGNLATASRFQRGTPAFRANTTAPELQRKLRQAEH